MVKLLFALLAAAVKPEICAHTKRGRFGQCDCNWGLNHVKNLVPGQIQAIPTIGNET